jgi:hypothetical protein
METQLVRSGIGEFHPSMPSSTHLSPVPPALASRSMSPLMSSRPSCSNDPDSRLSHPCSRNWGPQRACYGRPRWPFSMCVRTYVCLQLCLVALYRELIIHSPHFILFWNEIKNKNTPELAGHLQGSAAGRSRSSNPPSHLFLSTLEPSATCPTIGCLMHGCVLRKLSSHTTSSRSFYTQICYRSAMAQSSTQTGWSGMIDEATAEASRKLDGLSGASTRARANVASVTHSTAGPPYSFSRAVAGPTGTDNLDGARFRRARVAPISIAAMGTRLSYTILDYADQQVVVNLKLPQARPRC